MLCEKNFMNSDSPSDGVCTIGGFFLITKFDADLEEGIQQALKRAKEFSGSFLVSETLEIDNTIEPYAFFAGGKKLYGGERFFWKDPSGTQMFSGLGICKLIQSPGDADRFFHVEKKWRDAVKHVIRIGVQEIKCTGPIMFGGFSFDPLKEQTRLWSEYSHARLQIPEFLLTKHAGKTYLTTNILCTPYDDASLAENIIEKRKALLAVTPPEKVLSADIVSEEDVGKEHWLETVRKLVDELKNSEILKKVVMAREFLVTADNEIPVETVLRNLLDEQPDSYVFALEAGSSCFIGASPERLVKKTGYSVYSACVAGSIAKGRTEEEEKALGDKLLNDDKNLVEHQYVVEMIKDALHPVCSELSVPERPGLLKMRDIQHLFTPVTGKVREGVSLFEIVELLHPTPALGGFPKNEAMAKIRSIEKMDRGFYGSPIGWIDEQGDGEFAVAIRSGLIRGRKAHLFAGCGIVEDSEAESEWNETRIKFRPMLSALGGLKT